jgi:hypothetical protein
VITGFNTDVPYGGVTYHVQTEDKGLDTPLILSLVYVGGAIIASKRTPYEDLVGRGFDEEALTERLQRQHKLICAAIKAGRVEDLKRMATPNGEAATAGPDAPAEVPARATRKAGGQKRKKSEPPATPAAEKTAQTLKESASPLAEAAADTPAEVAAGAPAKDGTQVVVEPSPVEPAVSPAPAVVKSEPEIVILTTLADEINFLGDLPPHTTPKPPAPAEPAPPADVTTPAAVEEEEAAAAPVLKAEILESPLEMAKELYLTLLDDEGEFRAGQLATVKVYVGRGAYGRRPEPGASVMVKVLGTSFRPLILTATTDAQGVGVVRALLPRFTSGRAAIIIRAVAGEESSEIRRIIHQ